MTYGIIFWGNSTDSNEIFKLQKKAVRIITNSNNRTSCRKLFKELSILTLQSQYILSLALFVAQNMDEFANNSAIHQINTRHKSNLHPPLPRLTKYQKGVYYTGIKIFKCLPPKIKQLTGNIKKFKVALKNSY